MIFQAVVTKQPTEPGGNPEIILYKEPFLARNEQQARDFVVAELGANGEDLTKLEVVVKPF